MADLGWLRYAAPDQVPGLREVDRRARPWREVPDVARCPACFGALPPDTEAACSECGTGSWRPLAKPAPAPPAVSSWATFPNPPEEPAGAEWIPASTPIPPAPIYRLSVAQEEPPRSCMFWRKRG